jgi:hypothetical protein
MRPIPAIGMAAFVLCLGAAVRPATAQGAGAQTPQALQQQVDALKADLDRLQKDYQERLAKLEAALAALQGAQSPPPTATPAAPPSPPSEPAGPTAAGAAAATSSKVFNPDMAVIGNFLGVGGKNPVEGARAFEMRESEASFQAAVDPYARADFFLSFGESGVNLEEGFITFSSLPGGLLVKAGKMRAAFGKVNTMHTHVLPWADRPLVTANLLGGEDGIDDAGVSVARLIPNPWLFLEATGQVFRGDSDSVFASARRRDLSYVGHVRAYHDLTENANLDVGASYARGRSFLAGQGTVDEDADATLVGVDVMYRWKPLQRSIYHSFTGRSEVVWNRTPHVVGPSKGSGFFVSGDYQFARRWFAGGRYDLSDRASDLSLRDKGGSATLTFWPSEFSQVRGQYRRTVYEGESTAANELLFQLQFSIGAHGAHAF